MLFFNIFSNLLNFIDCSGVEVGIPATQIWTCSLWDKYQPLRLNALNSTDERHNLTFSLYLSNSQFAFLLHENFKLPHQFLPKIFANFKNHHEGVLIAQIPLPICPY